MNTIARLVGWLLVGLGYFAFELLCRSAGAGDVAAGVLSRAVGNAAGDPDDDDDDETQFDHGGEG